MSDKITVYKGTDKNMQCRGYQYELGKTEKSDDAIRCGDKGFHSCEAPLDVLKYYPMKNGNRYFVAEAGGKIDRTGAEDSKIASSELTLKAEVSLKGLISAHFEYTHKKAESGTKGGDRSALAGGDGSTLAGGDGSALAGGDGSTLAGGAWSALAGGNGSLIVGCNGCKAKGGKNSVIVLTEWGEENSEYVPICVKAVIVDGVNIKTDTYYHLKDGEIVEVQG